MTLLLRELVSAAPSLRGLARETGLDHRSLGRFVNGGKSLRLDRADALAEHFDLELVKIKRKGGG